MKKYINKINFYTAKCEYFDQISFFETNFQKNLPTCCPGIAHPYVSTYFTSVCIPFNQYIMNRLNAFSIKRCDSLSATKGVLYINQVDKIRPAYFTPSILRKPKRVSELRNVVAWAQTGIAHWGHPFST